MRVTHYRLVLLWLVFISTALLLSMAQPAPLAADGPTGRWVVVAKSDDDYDALRAETLRLGARILTEIRETRSLVVSAPTSFKTQAQTSQHTQGVAKDQILTIVQPAHKQELFNTTQSRKHIRIDLGKIFKHRTITPDPAFNLPGLLWNFARINASDAWRFSIGKPAVLIAVADTGLDFTHTELKNQIANSVDLTTTENPPLCKSLTGFSDDDLAKQYNGPAATDWNGHGTWIGGTIAAALDEQGINGIAPKAKLVAIKIAQWCGSAYTSTIVDAIRYAANNHIDVLSISYDGYLDRTQPDHELIYQQMVEAVQYARQKGTTIVASASNEHVRIGANGQVISHGGITIPGQPVFDYYGWYEVPGGIPGVIMVSATNNVTSAPSTACAAGTLGDGTTEPTCKPTTDKHQPFGVGKQNQLAYYSNYGPRIDIAGPGGSRKFNLPRADRGGTPGFPITNADGYTAWSDFGITSNFALELPCYVNLGDGFPANQCYTTIQGTSMAVPHVSAMAALVASRVPFVRHNPTLITAVLKIGALPLKGNTTPPLSATDTTPGDLTGAPCPDGYCHLGGDAISDREAYGAGLVSAYLLSNHEFDDDDHGKGNDDDHGKGNDDNKNSGSGDNTLTGKPTSTPAPIFLPMVGAPR